jgi:uncharacterized protein (DUF697 family)
MASCDCGTGLKNTGISGCAKPMGVYQKAFFVETYDSTGAKNKYDTSVPLTQVVLDALLNNADTSKRWYPTSTLETVGGERADNVVETAPSGRIYYIKDGIRTQSFELVGFPAKYIEAYESNRCVTLSVFYVDSDGNLIGGAEDGTVLYPKNIDAKSIQIKDVKMTDTTMAKIVMSFNYAISEKESYESYIESSSITADLLNASGLVDVTVEAVTTGQTSMTFKLVTNYGAVGNKIKDKGLLAANFVSTVGAVASKLRNFTTSADVAITGLTESAGVYTLTYASQTAGNVLIITPLANGRSYTAKNVTVV